MEHLKPEIGKFRDTLLNFLYAMEETLEKFLKNALSMAEDEKDSIEWFALRIGCSTFGIFDTFNHADAREVHLKGEIADD